MERNLFFSTNFEVEFDWAENYKFRLGSVRPHNKKQISDGLRDMSPESIRNRFLGSKRDFTEQELQYLTQLDGWNHYALGIEERGGARRGVAVVRIVRASHAEIEAEVAVTITDPFQRKGLGTFLMNLAMLAAVERKIQILSFTFLPQNEAIVKLIQKVATPYQGENTRDYLQLFVDLKEVNLEKIKSQLTPILPVIDNFHLKT